MNTVPDSRHSVLCHWPAGTLKPMQSAVGELGELPAAMKITPATRVTAMRLYLSANDSVRILVH